MRILPYVCFVKNPAKIQLNNNPATILLALETLNAKFQDKQQLLEGFTTVCTGGNFDYDI